MMRVWRLSDVCLSVAYIGPNSRTERPRKTKIGTEGSSRHTWLGHHFQGQKVKGQLVADVLNSQHAGIGATWRINTKILSTCKWRGHMCRHAHSLLEMRCFIECLTMSFDLVWFCFVSVHGAFLCLSYARLCVRVRDTVVLCELFPFSATSLVVKWSLEARFKSSITDWNTNTQVR